MLALYSFLAWGQQGICKVGHGAGGWNDNCIGRHGRIVAIILHYVKTECIPET
jgi:hypothetical protein